MSDCQKQNLLFANSIEAPAIMLLEEVPVVFYGTENGRLIFAHPHKGIQKIEFKQIEEELGEELRFVLPRRVNTTPTSRFGWNWFTPCSKNKKSLILVFVASLLAQMFA